MKPRIEEQERETPCSLKQLRQLLDVEKALRTSAEAIKALLQQDQRAVVIVAQMKWSDKSVRSETVRLGFNVVDLTPVACSTTLEILWAGDI